MADHKPQSEPRRISLPDSPIPPNEEARLAALCNLQILDTDADPSFDRLTRLASTIFGAPIALISFIEESRQWFKSKEGPITVSETPRTIAFCAHTILCDDVTVILDAREDPRFRENPLTSGTRGIRFYAGAPIKSIMGHNVGSICVADLRARTSFSSQEKEMLRLLADLASAATEVHRQNIELASNEAEARDRYSLVARATLDGVWDWNIGRDAVYYSPRWQYILGLPERDVYAGTAHWLDRIHPDDRLLVDAALQLHLHGKSSRFRSEHRVRHGDGSWRWVIVRGLAKRTKAGVATRMAGSLTDITKDKTSDLLTGLPNRLALIERLSQLISRAKSTHNWHFAVLFVDVDRFKSINDRLGHLGGDTVLKTVANRLQETVGRTRTNNDSVVARFAGDEFVILLDGVKNSSQAYGLAQRMHTAIAVPIEYEGEHLTTRISIGIAMAKPELDTPESFLHHSDLAMYRAKAAKNGSSVVFDPAMQEETATRMELEDRLREAISLEQLKVYYQPQVDLSTGKLIGCEALVRWQHPKRGVLRPGEFIAVAEEIGLVSLIDSWVMKIACAQLAEWLTLAGANGIKMSVNISSHSLSKRSLKYEVQALLAENDLPPSSLCLELTESTLMQDFDDGIRLMQELHGLGVGLHMDDFGSGYSSFQYLYKLPFDALKIDRSFMHLFPADPKVRSVVEGILALARTLGLRVVAEGIEDQNQVETLKSMGCEFGQGFLFDEPLPAEQFCQKYIQKINAITPMHTDEVSP